MKMDLCLCTEGKEAVEMENNGLIRGLEGLS